MAAQMANLLALSDAFCAPSTSPMAHLLLTCAANTIEATPNGRKPRTADRIAHGR
jgi:hypothetical protein